MYFIFKRNGRDLGGMFNTSPEMPMPPNWLHYIRVDTADAAAERVKANGGQVLNGPMDVPGGDRVAQCSDPQGAMFAVHSKA
jgi:predicted enzyme related to lactoylglutathione lyase